MSRRIAIFTFFLVTAMLLTFTCSKRDLRGWWRPSADGKTYLVLEDGDGLKKGQYCLLDGQVWPYGAGERGEIEPGTHEIGCPAKVGFKVEAGMEYHFDYWGP